MHEMFTFAGLINSSHGFVFVTHVVLVAAIVIVLAKLATSKMQLVPSGVQNIMEAYIEGVMFMGKDVVGEQLTRKYLPLIATLGLFIFVSNMIGIIPGFEAPSSNLNMTLALALIVFFYYHFEGIREHGVLKYVAHFMGPNKLLAPLMFPIEIVSHFSRLVSLSFRLFGNIKGEDLFLAIILMLVPWLAPLPAYALLLFSGVLQTFIFMILTFVYLAGAVLASEDH